MMRFGFIPRLIAAFVVAIGTLYGCAPGASRGPTILAASSLQQPLEALGEEWVAAGHNPPVFSFASSATLARQIENGSPADIFISADAEWTKYIATAGKLPPDAVQSIAGNRLVIARSIRKQPLNGTGREAGIQALRQARSIATGDPDAVPLGRYAREALENSGLWPDIAPRIVPAPSSGAALKLVLLEEADIGILYASDARRRSDLGIIYAIPANAHAPIIYDAVLLPGSAHPDAAGFFQALTQPSVQTIFDNNGFGRP